MARCCPGVPPPWPPRFTAAFEDTCAWLVCHAALSVVAVLLRVAWRSVAAIVTRVVAARAGQLDRLAGLRRIGIDEISYRKGQRFLLVVTDHDTGLLVWAGKNRDAATLSRFFDELGADRAAALTHVSADGADWIHDVVAQRASKAVGVPGRLPRRRVGHRGPGPGPPRHGQPAARRRAHR